MKKSTGYSIFVISGLVVFLIIDLIFKLGFFKELNLANAVFTAFVGLGVVISLSGDDDNEKD